jgi:hypothetical protein
LIEFVFHFSYRRGGAILNLEDQVRQLQEELNELKNRPSSSVGKVEYKFDQLKVFVSVSGFTFNVSVST